MSNNDKIKCMVADCTMSLTEAVQDAGGRISSKLLDMSVRDFIATVAAQNRIRFICEKREESDQIRLETLEKNV